MEHAPATALASRSAATTSTAEVLDDLERDGAVIVRDVLSPELVAAILEELDPYLAGTGLIDNDLVGRLTTRTGALVARSPSARTVVTHPLALAAARTFLGRFSADIQLNLTQIMRLLPGQTPQQLHRDRFLWSRHLPREVEPMFNCMWALTDFTEENGATRVIPGSHRWAWDHDASQEQTIAAAMPAGSVLFYTGTVVHGGGHNRSDAPRVGMNITYLLGWLRQEENQYLSCPPEVARDLDPELRALLGYSAGNGSLGYYSVLDAPAGHPDLYPGESAASDASFVTGERIGEQSVF